MSLTVSPFSSPFLTNPANGDGTCTVIDASGFVTGSICRVSADGQPTKVGKIQRIVGNVVTIIEVTGTGRPLDITSYLITRKAALTVGAQTVTSGRVGGDPRPVYTTGTGADVVGVATLVAGSATVSTTKVKAGSLIVLSRKAVGGTAGNLTYGTIVAGTSFVISSSNGADTSDVVWQLLT